MSFGFFGMSTGVGGQLVLTYWPLFPFFIYVSLSKKQCLKQKSYFAKVNCNTQRSRSCPLFRSFGGLLVLILEFTGNKALQAVSKCTRIFFVQRLRYVVSPGPTSRKFFLSFCFSVFLFFCFSFILYPISRLPIG